MRTIDEIIAESHKATEAALREAFEAGKAHATTDLKSKVVAFFETLGHTAETHTEPQPAPEQHWDNPEHHGDHPSGDQPSNEHHY